MIGYDDYVSMNVVTDPNVQEPEPEKIPPPYTVDLKYALTKFPSNEFARLINLYSNIFDPKLVERYYPSTIANNIKDEYFKVISEQLPSLSTYDRDVVIDNVNRMLTTLLKLQMNPDIDNDIKFELVAKDMLRNACDLEIQEIISEYDLYKLFQDYIQMSKQPGIWE
ncbi:MAG: hypothetical protein GXO10_06265 [Crenarchaeota archaeon]|nr:hypothetical protein [Thermoproteota archaeon]